MAKLVLKSSAKCIVKHPVMSGRRWPTRTSRMKNSKPATVTYGYKKSEKYSSDREGMRRHCTVQSRTGKTTAFSIAILQSMDTTLHMTDPIHILVKRDELTLEGIKQFFVTTITQAVIFCNTEFRSGQSRC